MAARIPGTKPRPICALCGKPYGRRNTKEQSVFWADGEPEPPPYNGNNHLIREWRLPHDEAYAQGTRSVPGLKFNDKTGHYEGGIPGRTIYRETWDGESYWNTQCAPFCGNTCAVAFAKCAYENGFRARIPKKDA